jgi:aminoglycoside 6'-N-acetyltransferase I
MPVRQLRDSDRAQVLRWKSEIWGSADEPPDELVWVWESDSGDLGGFVSASIRPWAEGCSSAPVPYVEGWYVVEPLRGRGVGRTLVAAVEVWARSSGFTELGSDAELENEVSLAAHERLGFVPTERVQFFRKTL